MPQNAVGKSGETSSTFEALKLNAPKVKDSNLVGVWACTIGFSASFVYCSIVLSDDSKQLALTVLSSSLAAIAGWGLGVIVSPYKDETETFSQLWTAVSGVISGIVIAKGYEYVLDVWNGRYGPVPPSIRYRIALGIGWFAVFTFHTFLIRHYGTRGEGRNPVGFNPAVLRDIQEKVAELHQSTVVNKAEKIKEIEQQK